MAHAPSSADHGDHPLAPMMQAENSAPAAPRGGRWRRFLNRIGIGRKRVPGHYAAAQPPATPIVPPPYGAYPPYGGQQWDWEAAQRYYQQQYGASQWYAHPQGYAPQQPGGQQYAPYQTGWQQSFAPQPAAAPPTAPPQAAPEPPPAAPQPEPEPEPQPASKSNGQQQKLVTATLAGLAMRDLTLVESMIEIVEDMEDSSEDPEILGKLFKIDNLATRMRRNGENLLVLAGQDTGDPSTEPVPLLDVARAAISEISEYQRVQLGRLPELFVSGNAADDISHLLAELMDNATEKSPDHAQVVISAQAMPGGRLLITVEDEGIGIPPEQLESFNDRLRGEPVLDEEVMRHMGLYVVSRIAHRYGVEVQLEGRAFRGVSAHVVLPAELYTTTGPRPASEPSRHPMAASSAQPDKQSASAGQRSAATASRAQGSSPEQPAPSPRVQEDSSAMESSQSPVTSAGLPRRSAHRNTAPVPMAPPEEANSSEDDTAAGQSEEQSDSGADRAERIRADLEGFIEGQQQAASSDD
ncbi:sensor histidine kinase [Allosalinactinospora lopnorensis]|uniref:sensor histidine kinase n=1 Tax=Allosalinactinospora lopnorensis TaxID=1352348 RepID=UPI000B08D31F|nr:ATP-binding protein [Allosalinactinospora lopnorensis]